ncbi:T-cell immunoglobulin and mucin domain-containing protein 4-like [Micropterus dolomieu]|uniref:T-cell immunoglobulin and mucin domain-containing protein 4-like n=1 Tax=Micropterus dolomieu TaxID=147949 RepID=UPI001E8D371B|nr:T-cell immunoglobulin and mucin domain-containing protein 4-like [Micropterus dolomieu]
MWIMKTESRLDLMLLLVLLTVGESDGSSVVGQTGQSVTLSCKYDISKHGAQHVCWGRGEIPTLGCGDQLVSTDGHKVRTRASSRYQLLGRLEAGDVSLTILDLTETDAGRYGCRVRVQGPFNDNKHHLDLIVERAPLHTSTVRSTTISALTGSDVTESKPTEVTWAKEVTRAPEMWITAVQQQQQVNSLQSLFGNTVRVSFIVFIPAVLLITCYRVWRRNQTDRRLNQSEEEDTETEAAALRAVGTLPPPPESSESRKASFQFRLLLPRASLCRQGLVRRGP